MKKNIILLIVALAFIGSSCNDFLSIDRVNPNNASAVAPKLVLPACLNRVASTIDNPRRFDFVYLWYGQWSISAGYVGSTVNTQYRLLNSTHQEAFDEFYITAKNLDVVEKSATDPKDAYYAAIAKIMKAYIFQNLVDIWGDVPYTDAFQTDKGNLKPKYDGQQSIYEDLVTQLDAAMTLIQGAPADANTLTSPGIDIMYSGNMNLWLKFANTLKLRILIHQSDMVGRTTYITGALATTSNIGYLGAGESALVNPGYLVSTGKMNPFYETFYNSAGSSQSDGITYYTAGKDAVDFMVANNDARLGKFFLPYAGNSYAGNVMGTLPANLSVFSKTSKLGYIIGDPGTMIGTPTKSSPILTDFESLFIQAEAVDRGLITGDEKSLYESAVTQSYLYMNLQPIDAAAYLGQSNGKVNYDLAPDKKDLILTQKWLSLNGIAPVEIWTDYRRTGIPSFIKFSPDPSAVSAFPPIRLLYPQNELNVNNDNVLAVGAINAFTTKIFWQK
jgi:hypothetical protein